MGPGIQLKALFSTGLCGKKPLLRCSIFKRVGVLFNKEDVYTGSIVLSTKTATTQSEKRASGFQVGILESRTLVFGQWCRLRQAWH